MKNSIAILSILVAFSGMNAYGQRKKDLNIDYQIRGHIYAYSSIIDSSALGGFARSSNLPSVITDSSMYSIGKVCIVIDTIIRQDSSKYNHMTLYIANLTDSISSFDAQDSRLYAIPEAVIDGKWQPIGYLPNSWCGNSYHSIFLSAGEQWDFPIPRFKGKLKTKMRYRLVLPNNQIVYSNEITARINKKQAIGKQGHTRQGLMDPYND